MDWGDGMGLLLHLEEPRLTTESEKNEKFPDSKIFVAKTFWIKRVNCINLQVRDKYV